ncbi:hypothetical protein CQ14_06595 [Bradyrhizobium lablabi]|uniref:Uncharacterized protein n=1 Tax=Bradyrhizobium lablabi TaxID=722472 RepID=A0A0R3MUL7_9BRAD|nr:hypothetical protein CQ14_06595 [Bradyrhizobium lablabi]
MNSRVTSLRLQAYACVPEFPPDADKEELLKLLSEEVQRVRDGRTSTFFAAEWHGFSDEDVLVMLNELIDFVQNCFFRERS